MDTNTNPFVQFIPSTQSQIEGGPGKENKSDESKDSSDGMSLDAFLIHFLRNHRDDNFLSIKHGNYTVTSDEAVGEIVDWTMQYLQYM